MADYCRFCGYPVEGSTCAPCDLRFRRASGKAPARCSHCRAEMPGGARVCPSCGRLAASRAVRAATTVAALVAGAGLGGVAWFVLREFLSRS